MSDYKIGGPTAKKIRQQQRKNTGQRLHASKPQIRDYIKKAERDYQGSQEFPISWEEIKGQVNDKADWLTENVRGALWCVGIDAVAIEVGLQLGVGFGYGGVNFTPVGIAAYFPTHSGLQQSVSDSEWQKIKANGNRPIADAPHWFFYKGASIEVGLDAGASIGVDWQFALADHFGNPEDIRAGSWAGPVVAVDVEAAVATPIGGLEGSRSFFTSVGGGSESDTETYGVLPAIQPPDGFQGTAVSVEPKYGAELELSVGAGGVLTNRINDALSHFSRPALQKDLKEYKQNAEKRAIASDAQGGEPEDGEYFRAGKDSTYINQFFTYLFK